MTLKQHQENVGFELRLLRWRATQRRYSPAELEQQLGLLTGRLGVAADEAWVQSQLADFRAVMAREFPS